MKRFPEASEILFKVGLRRVDFPKAMRQSFGIGSRVAFYLVRQRFTEEVGEIFPSIVRHPEQLLEIEVLQKIVSSDIQDNRDLRFKVRDIAEVLIWPHSDVGLARWRYLQKKGNDMNVGRFIGNEIVGIEITRGLAPI